MGWVGKEAKGPQIAIPVRSLGYIQVCCFGFSICLDTKCPKKTIFVQKLMEKKINMEVSFAGLPKPFRDRAHHWSCQESECRSVL